MNDPRSPDLSLRDFLVIVVGVCVAGGAGSLIKLMEIGQ